MLPLLSACRHGANTYSCYMPCCCLMSPSRSAFHATCALWCVACARTLYCSCMLYCRTMRHVLTMGIHASSFSSLLREYTVSNADLGAALTWLLPDKLLLQLALLP